MKKILMSTAIAAMFLATSCQNEEVVTSGNKKQSELTIQVTKGMDSRLAMDGTEMVWSEGDQIFVYGGSASGTLTLVDGADETTASFSGFVYGNISDIRYVVYGNDKTSTPDNVTFTLGNMDADECKVPMFGTFNNEDDRIELNNLCGLVKVTITDLVQGMTKASITGKGIAGTLKLENGKLVPGTAEETIEVDGIGDGEAFYVPMFAPQDKTPVELTVVYNGAEDKQMVNLKAGAMNVSDMPKSYYFKDGSTVLYSENLNDTDNEEVSGTTGVLKNEEGEYVVSANEGLEYILDLNERNIVINLAGDLTVNVKPWETLAFGGTSTETITINGNGNTLTFNQLDSDWNHVTTVNNAKLIINNAHITNSGHNNGPWNRHDINFACPIELVDVISDKAIALKNAGTLNNVTIKDANTSDTYAIWIQPNGQTVTLNNSLIDMVDCTDGRGIKIDEQYVDSPVKVTLNVSNTTFKTEEKSAILVKSKAGADIALSNIDITGVYDDKVCAVWVDADRAIYDYLVSVTGGSKMIEGYAAGVSINKEENYELSTAEAMFWFANEVNVNKNAFSGKTVKLVANIDLANEVWEPIGQTGKTEFKGIFDGQNKTIKNVNIDKTAATDEHTSSGLFGWAESNVIIKNVKIDGAIVKGNHNVAVIVGYTYSGKISNCHVTNADIVCTHANEDACGDKCGLIAGYAGDESRFTDCSASNSTVKAGRDAGQLIGTGYNVSVSNCSATNVTVTANGDCNGANIRNEVIGRVMN